MYDGGGGDPLTYFEEVGNFLLAAKVHASRQNTRAICCPCKRCKNNSLFEDHEVIREHLLEKGFIKDMVKRQTV